MAKKQKMIESVNSCKTPLTYKQILIWYTLLI